MSGRRLIVMYLTGNEHLDGQWHEIPLDQPLRIVHSQDLASVQMIPTGNVEWRDDGACAEVWVPEDRLELWRAEHDVDAGA